MRLLNTSTLQVVEFLSEKPQYAILSHTWGEEEVAFHDLSRPDRRTLKGWKKVERCCRLARSEGWGYVWIDTCCINKAASGELGEAINSMFRWYQEAQICYAFLEDVPPRYCSDGKSRPANGDVTDSRWFTRGWTLQELLAPPFLAFLDSSWNIIGSRETYTPAITYATKIEQKDFHSLKSCSIATKFSWAASRQTTRAEDRAYSLMGFLGVYMPLLYGEGRNAFVRLQQELIRQFNDETVLLWTTYQASLFYDDPKLLARYEAAGRYPGWLIRRGLFAESLENFSGATGLIVRQFDKIPRHFGISNAGISLSVELFQLLDDEESKYQQHQATSSSPALYAIKLNCARTTEPNEPMVLPLAPTKSGHPVYEVLRSSYLRTWKELVKNTKRFKGAWQSLGRHSIILASPILTADSRSSNTLISIHVTSSSLFPSLSTREYLACKPIDDGREEQWSCAIPKIIPTNSKPEAGLSFMEVKHFGVIVLRDRMALMVDGTLYMRMLSVTLNHSQQPPVLYVLVVYSSPPFPRFGIWHHGKTHFEPNEVLNHLNRNQHSDLAPPTEEGTLRPEGLLEYLNRQSNPDWDFLDNPLDYPHTAPLGDDLVLQVAARPIPFSPEDSLSLRGQSFHESGLAEETEASYWLDQAAANELSISKHVRLEISIIAKDLVVDDDPEEGEWGASNESLDDDMED
ncbi:putative vegetative incompatibility protein HET-E-1 [Triangularia verruculosa]|uniref:Vegetative incompatibility protein HET-E-1 n=1 Tax=Triangularia verruculosa TaxID=2587418 RepID=A0AAN6XHY1_9PEZI|nr:putative vegetative incompatibility protein HET-E-1 [Triangularia verruculosa]